MGQPCIGCTKSTIVSENIKWNKSIGNKKQALLLLRNANAFNGKAGYEGLKNRWRAFKSLKRKAKLDEEKPEKIKVKDIMFGCRTRWSPKNKNSISDIVEKLNIIKINIFGLKCFRIMTTDLVPKLAMEECKIKYLLKFMV